MFFKYIAQHPEHKNLFIFLFYLRLENLRLTPHTIRTVFTHHLRYTYHRLVSNTPGVFNYAHEDVLLLLIVGQRYMNVG